MGDYRRLKAILKLIFGNSAIVFLIMVLLAGCKKDPEEIDTTILNFRCFDVDEQKQQLFLKYQVDLQNQDTVFRDTVRVDVLTLENNVFELENLSPNLQKLYIDNVFGLANSTSPLQFDTLLVCDSEHGDSYSSDRPSFNHTPKYTVAGLNVSKPFLGEKLPCYLVDFYDGESSMNYVINKKFGLLEYKETICPGGVTCQSTIWKRLK